jgi:hypothetical protein
MKLTLCVVLISALLGPAVAQTSPKKLSRFADATSDACVANCASQNESCKRVCPTTFSTPCLNACDSQAQTCRQGCQPR